MGHNCIFMGALAQKGVWKYLMSQYGRNDMGYDDNR